MQGIYGQWSKVLAKPDSIDDFWMGHPYRRWSSFLKDSVIDELKRGHAKVYLAHMVHKVIDTAIQLHGALGYSQDTVLAKWYTQVRSQRLVDGPDEVHKWKVGRNVIKAFREHGTTASAAGGDLL